MDHQEIEDQLEKIAVSHVRLLVHCHYPDVVIGLKIREEDFVSLIVSTEIFFLCLDVHMSMKWSSVSFIFEKVPFN